MTELEEGDTVQINQGGGVGFDGETSLKGKRGIQIIKNGETITTMDKGKKYVMKAESDNCEVMLFDTGGKLISGSWRCVRKQL